MSTRLPADLQARLDVILAKPVLRKTPRLTEAIAVLVRGAYERHPHSPVPAGDGSELEADAVTLEQAVAILDRRFHESVTQDRVTAGTAHAWVRYAARVLRLEAGRETGPVITVADSKASPQVAPLGQMNREDPR